MIAFLAAGSLAASASAQTTLQNNMAVGSIAGSAGSQKFYRISVPSGQASLEIKISGGSGDCDLYVKRGSQPTKTSWDYRPYMKGNSEAVTVNNPASGDWFVMLNGSSAYSGVTLVAKFTAPPSVVMPTFSVASGTFTSSIAVGIGCGTSGATIRYTTNGNDPTSSSSVYSGPLTISTTTMLKARAFKFAMTDSAVATATYTINIPVRISTPVISPSSGSSFVSKKVNITCPNAGVVIRYTTDGSEPSSSSAIYSSPFFVYASSTIKAKAFKSGMIDSYSASVSYTVTDYDVATLNNVTNGLFADSGEQGSESYYKVQVPAGQKLLEVKTSGGSGDCNLYVSRGRRPTISNYDYRSQNAGNNEIVSIANPASGDWYFMVRGFYAFSNVSSKFRMGTFTAFEVPEDAWGSRNTTCGSSAINGWVCALAPSSVGIPALPSVGGTCFGIATLELRWFKIRLLMPKLPRIQALASGVPTTAQDAVAIITQNQTAMQNMLGGIWSLIYCQKPLTVCNAMKAELQNGRPGMVTMKVSWNGQSGGHAIVAYGYSENDQQVCFFISDSNTLRPNQAPERLCYNKSNASWSYSYDNGAMKVSCLAFTPLGSL